MKFFSLFVLFLLSTTLNAQTLLLNGGFEDVNTCSEYKVECAPEAWISSLNSIANFCKDRKAAHGGSNSMAVEAGHDKKIFNRTFIRSRLTCGLRKGNSYQLSFYIKSAHPVFDSVGILFSDSDPLLAKTPFHKLVPTLFLEAVTHPMGITDSSWKKVELRYIATGEERFIAFGYFGRNDFKGTKVNPLENRFFFFLDDISMVPLDPNEGICRGWQSVKEDIYEENERHEWLDRKLKYYRSNPPPPPVVTTNTYVRIDTLLMPDILFASGKAVLQTQSYSLLDSFCRKIRSSQVDSIVIEGHTDSTGTVLLNQQLSLNRAHAVSQYLSDKTGYGNITARGRAAERPVGDNKTPGGRQKNRRVEVLLFIRE